MTIRKRWAIAYINVLTPGSTVEDAKKKLGVPDNAEEEILSTINPDRSRYNWRWVTDS